MSSGPMPRDAHGRIIVGPLFGPAVLDDQVPVEPEAPRPVAAVPATTATRRPGETPTPFGQQRGVSPAAPAPVQPKHRWAAYGLAALLCAAAAWAFFASATPAASPTAAPTAAATAAPAPTAAALTLARAVVAYDAPDGAPVGALEPGRPYTVAQVRDGWRQLDAQGAGLVWVRAWEMDGASPPTATPLPTAIPVPTAIPAPVVVVPVGPAVTCVPVVDGDNGNAYLGEACGTTAEERQARALDLLVAAP